jgi:hypothetical protein
MYFFQKNKKLNKQQKEFQQRVKTFIDDLNLISQKHKVGARPIITKYQLDIEFYDLKQAEK